MSKTPTKYYQLTQNDTSADLYIFGDICAWAWQDVGEQSGVTIVNQLKELDVDTINVHINSYGGDVSEGLAIYNVLREHKAALWLTPDQLHSVQWLPADQSLVKKISDI